MLWRILSDLLLAAHAGWVLFNVFGPLWCWKRPRWRLVHLGTMALTLGFMVFMGGCPLTDLENYFLRRSDPAAAYLGGFIAHYLGRIVYWEVSPGAIGLATVVWFVGWLIAYLRLWIKERG